MTYLDPATYPVWKDHDPNEEIDETAAARGENLWNHTCGLCHGIAGIGAGSVAPDLRESAAAHNYDSLRVILKEGTLALGGMPKFDDRTDSEVRDVFMYIRKISKPAPSASPQ